MELAVAELLTAIKYHKSANAKHAKLYTVIEFEDALNNRHHHHKRKYGK
jgi:hypothetical protein